MTVDHDQAVVGVKMAQGDESSTVRQGKKNFWIRGVVPAKKRPLPIATRVRKEQGYCTIHEAAGMQSAFVEKALNHRPLPQWIEKPRARLVQGFQISNPGTASTGLHFVTERLFHQHTWVQDDPIEYCS